MKQTEILTHATHVNGWFPAVYMSCVSQNFRLFHVSNLSVRNFRIFLLMYTWSVGPPIETGPARSEPVHTAPIWTEHAINSRCRANQRSLAAGRTSNTGPSGSHCRTNRGRLQEHRAGHRRRRVFGPLHDSPNSHATAR